MNDQERLEEIKAAISLIYSYTSHLEEMPRSIVDGHLDYIQAMAKVMTQRLETCTHLHYSEDAYESRREYLRGFREGKAEVENNGSFATHVLTHNADTPLCVYCQAIMKGGDRVVVAPSA